MSGKKGLFILCLFMLFGFVCLLFANAGANGERKVERVRVGVFDSRAVVIAFAASEAFKKELESKRAEIGKAKADGDIKKVEQLEEWGREHQEGMHRQGFGKAPVHNLLTYIKEDIPEVAEEAGIEVIISKWEIVYQGPNVELIDITDEIVRPYKPGEKQLKFIKQMKETAPLTEEELDKLDWSE